MNQLLFCAFLFLIGCSNHTTKAKTNAVDKKSDALPITENYIKLSYGIETEIDTSNPMEVAMYLLNKSDYKGFISSVKKIKGRIDTVYWHSGFYALIIPDSNLKSYERSKPGYYNPQNYLSYRYNNFMGDIANDEQGILLETSFNDADKNDLFNLQSTIEWGNLYDTLRTPDSIGALEVAEGIKNLKRLYPQSKRLNFLLANSYLVLHKEQEALNIFDDLLGKDYYALPILKKLIIYFGKEKNYELQKKYLKIFKKQFPNECLLLPINDQQLTGDEVLAMCKTCLKNGTQRDSIRANLYLAKYSLEIKDYKRVDSITDLYFQQKGPRDSYDPLKLYEDDIYPDIKMQSLFLQGKYEKINKYFSSLEVGEKRRLEFRNKILMFYENYISKDTSSYQSFYLKFFK